VQVDPIKLTSKAPGTKHLKCKCVEPPSNLAFSVNLRRYTKDTLKELAAETSGNVPWNIPSTTSFFQADIVGADCLAWNLPHTCLFQSDIVGFTALTQRIAPHKLVAGSGSG